MTSSVNPVIMQVVDGNDNDDEFDWEAAVEQIDVACDNSSLKSSSLVVDNPNQLHYASINNSMKPSTSRQTTLDRFIEKAGPSRVPEVQPIENPVEWASSSVDIDAEAAKTWIYPVNIPLRDYQFAITKTALFSNTLVALPTGLGKTLIAAVVMFNYFRWFPNGKIVFAAPSRPLVIQQIEACHNIVGIPQEWTIDMTGQISPAKRAFLWRTKRVFFVTPQVLEKDIQSGTCLVKFLVCLVIDEAHRATGNYSSCVAVRELLAVPVQLRILALTATPGSKHDAVQRIIDNLQISTLEYRNESDPDVIQYVHDRKLELLEVEMGKDAVEITNLLLEVIRPYVARLSAIGLLQNRDYQTLSPCDLLNSRDKFRQAPPQNLPQVNYGEVEGYFGALITLYHIRKLLSSHGIRPAFEMLEEKLKQGHFARFMSRNETIGKVKLLMEQSLSHGAPSPKLAKLLEIMTDHFKTKNPQNSRVIIFSNFRGSVRDIMSALAKLGGLVKATEFIGQSSGKALKGQSQKVQQAVLEKFRAGGYNVIVATSIGEEGLDIMEVDLVVCFDANVSPLRMIQRMGSELKGYMRKQSSGRAIKKHMRNGGMNSFTFHPSPRMIPHIFKPEVQLVELSIEEFVHRGKKIKEDPDKQSPSLIEKLTTKETELLEKYNIKNIWRPSLIAFPHFQAIPSRVNKVMHSCRTGMLIDTMQRLQGFSFSSDGKSFYVEEDKFLGVDNVEHHDNVSEEPTKSERSTSPLPCKSDSDQDIFDGGCEVVPDSPISEENPLVGENNIIETQQNKVPMKLADEHNHDLNESELSPRLADMIEIGIVPESPINDAEKNTNSIMDNVVCVKDSPVHPTNEEIRTPLPKTNPISPQREQLSPSPIGAIRRTPMGNLTNSSCSADWCLKSADKSQNDKQLWKFKRLRKVGDTGKDMNPDCRKENSVTQLNLTGSTAARPLQRKQTRGKTRLRDDARAFIEEEAEVSSETGVSADEEDIKDSDSYDDSFIDDRINPTAATQVESGRIDMMAIYRRSLLSQSPSLMQPYFSPDSMTRITESGGSSRKTLSSEIMPCTDAEFSVNNKKEMESRKRKLTFEQSRSTLAINLERQLLAPSENVHQSEQTAPKAFIHDHGETSNANELMSDDDDLFYQSLDLDAVEAQATMLLKHKSEIATQKQETIPKENQQQNLVQNSPSFDLGIW
ncbi:hypothetical protein ACFE04_006722 [Oxalis oulophora]